MENDCLEIEYRRSNRAKYLRITVKADQSVVLTIPKRVSIKEAEKFVQSKYEWIQKQLQIFKKLPACKEVPKLSRDEIAAARDELLLRLEYFSKKFNLPYGKVTFRKQKTMWGSCSENNNISLNISLAYLPSHLQDYILLHELCHTVHKNHSAKFWSELDRLVGASAKGLRKELRGYRI